LMKIISILSARNTIIILKAISTLHFDFTN
jgi:hypothetical protein